MPHLPTADPHSENYYSWSPYVYVGNNPMNLIDPNGKDWVYRIVDGVHEIYYDRGVRSQDDVNIKYGSDGGVTHFATGATATISQNGKVAAQFTFTNDAENNKYGSVTDINGNTLDNSQITYGSNYTIFGTTDNSANAETLHKNYFGTSYIGPDNPKGYTRKDSYQYAPRNLSEYPAYFHDKDYDALGLRGPEGVLVLQLPLNPT